MVGRFHGVLGASEFGRAEEEGVGHGVAEGGGFWGFGGGLGVFGGVLRGEGGGCELVFGLHFYWINL